MAESLKPKKTDERTCGELRERANSKTTSVRDAARGELRRRCDNLRGAVIPAWETAERGPDPSRWRLW